MTVTSSYLGHRTHSKSHVHLCRLPALLSCHVRERWSRTTPRNLIERQHVVAACSDSVFKFALRLLNLSSTTRTIVLSHTSASVSIGQPHNSLMPLELNGFRVHIESDGKELPQYQVKRVDATTTRCYIPSEAGKVGSGTSLRVAKELTLHDVHRATRSSRLSSTLHARLTMDSSRISWLKES